MASPLRGSCDQPRAGRAPETAAQQEQEHLLNGGAEPGVWRSSMAQAVVAATFVGVSRKATQDVAVTQRQQRDSGTGGRGAAAAAAAEVPLAAPAEIVAVWGGGGRAASRYVYIACGRVGCAAWMAGWSCCIAYWLP